MTISEISTGKLKRYVAAVDDDMKHREAEAEAEFTHGDQDKALIKIKKNTRRGEGQLKAMNKIDARENAEAKGAAIGFGVGALGGLATGNPVGAAATAAGGAYVGSKIGRMIDGTFNAKAKKAKVAKTNESNIVYHEIFGEGQLLTATEVLDEEDNLVAIDVMFEHGIESFDSDDLQELSRGAIKRLQRAGKGIPSTIDAKKMKNRDTGIDLATAKIKGQSRVKEETEVSEARSADSSIGTRLVSKHEGKDGHEVHVRYNPEWQEYSVHHYHNGKHLGEGPVSYHGEGKEGKQDAEDTAKYAIAHYKVKGGKVVTEETQNEESVYLPGVGPNRFRQIDELRERPRKDAGEDVDTGPKFISSLMKAADSPQGGEVHYHDGSKKHISRSDCHKTIQKMRSLTGPGTNADEREAKIKAMGANHEAHMKHINEDTEFNEGYNGEQGAADELRLHGDNTAHLYHQSYKSIVDNLTKKSKKGVYDHEKAKKLWKYHADRVAKDYEKQHGGKFSPGERKLAASDWADSARDEYGFGTHHEGRVWDDDRGAKGRDAVNKTDKAYDAKVEGPLIKMDTRKNDPIYMKKSRQGEFKESTYTASQRYVGVENSIMEIMNQNRDVRQEAIVEKWNTENPTLQIDESFKDYPRYRAKAKLYEDEESFKDDPRYKEVLKARAKMDAEYAAAPGRKKAEEAHAKKIGGKVVRRSGPHTIYKTKDGEHVTHWHSDGRHMSDYGKQDPDWEDKLYALTDPHWKEDVDGSHPLAERWKAEDDEPDDRKTREKNRKAERAQARDRKYRERDPEAASEGVVSERWKASDDEPDDRRAKKKLKTLRKRGGRERKDFERTDHMGESKKFFRLTENEGLHSDEGFKDILRKVAKHYQDQHGGAEVEVHHAGGNNYRFHVKGHHAPGDGYYHHVHRESNEFRPGVDPGSANPHSHPDSANPHSHDHSDPWKAPAGGTGSPGHHSFDHSKQYEV